MAEVLSSENSNGESIKVAVLGSTGNTGKAIIEQLLKRPNVHINAFCRNKRKLFDCVPGIAGSKTVAVYEGSINDVDLLARCLDHCHIAFLLASTNSNVPSCRISQDLTITTIAALEQLRNAGPLTFTPPKLVLLSSATVDDHLSRHMGFFRHIMMRAASNVYEDLMQAEKILRKHESWLTTIYIKPGGLSLDVQRGHRLSLDEEETFVSYQDLAAGMIEAATETSGRWDSKNVGLVNANGKAKFARGTPMCILVGLVRYYFPGLHPYLLAGGPA